MLRLFKFWILAICIGCRISVPTVAEVVSADTIILSDGSKLRYAGLEVPASDNPWFAFARDANVYLVQEKTVQVIVEPNLAQSGITVGYVYTPVLIDKEVKYLFVNAEMARFGFAKVLPIPEKCQYKELWQSLWKLQEEEAKPFKRGIWSGSEPNRNSD